MKKLSDEKVLNELYNMNLMDKMYYGPFTVYRVPGGWIFSDITSMGATNTFIPYIQMDMACNKPQINIEDI